MVAIVIIVNVKSKEVDKMKLFEELKEAGIYVRHWNDPKIKDYLRITIGTDEEMKIFLDFLKKKIGA